MIHWPDLGYESYSDYLNSTVWKEKALAIKKHMGEKCEICFSKESLEVHHITYNNITNESLKDLVVLCKSCHEEAHKSNNENVKLKIKRLLEW